MTRKSEVASLENQLRGQRRDSKDNLRQMERRYKELQNWNGYNNLYIGILIYILLMIEG